MKKYKNIWEGEDSKINSIEMNNQSELFNS